MSSKDAKGIVPKVEHGNELVITDSLKSSQSQLPFLLQADVVPGHHNGLRDELSEVRPHLVVVVVQQLGHFLHGKAGSKELGSDFSRGHGIF